MVSMFVENPLQAINSRQQLVTWTTSAELPEVLTCVRSFLFPGAVEYTSHWVGFELLLRDMELMAKSGGTVLVFAFCPAGIRLRSPIAESARPSGVRVRTGSGFRLQGAGLGTVTQRST